MLSTVLASEMAFSNSRCSPDPDSSASSRFNCREGVQFEKGYTLNKSLVVYELFRILIYEVGRDSPAIALFLCLLKHLFSSYSDLLLVY